MQAKWTHDSYYRYHLLRLIEEKDLAIREWFDGARQNWEMFIGVTCTELATELNEISDAFVESETAARASLEEKITEEINALLTEG